MKSENRKKHWENIYQTKTPEQVSWTQEIPETSLKLILSLALDKNANIIDVGGGDSKLVDFLIAEGYRNITVLDISTTALEKAKKRLGKDADFVEWIASDIVDYKPNKTFDVWHDRAAFHFLTTEEEVSSYITTVTNSVKESLIIGTFSKDGPLKCSGLNISQYSESSLKDRFILAFEPLQCHKENHTTPFNTQQNFLFCSFRRKELLQEK